MRLFISIIISFFITASTVQSGPNTFYRKYNLPGMQGALGLVSMPDGGFVGTGQHEGNGSAGDCDVFVYRVDACGNLLWMRLLGTPAIEGGKSICRRNNGNLLVAGLFDLKGMIIELDPNGNLVWEKRYDNTTWTLSIDECLNGDLMVTCMTANSGYAIMRCNSTGNVLWSKLITGLGDYPISIITLSNGNFFVNSTFNITGKDFAGMLIDASGNIIWSKTYGGIGYVETDYQSWGSKAIYDSTDNTIVIIGQTTVNSTDDIILTKIMIADGSVIWSKIIGDGGSDQARDLVRTKSGFAITGNTNGYPIAASSNPTILTEDLSERDVLLVNLDSLGNLLWARTYGGIERDKGIGLHYYSDNTFLINAYSSSPVFGNADSSMDPLFIKTDSLGLVACQFNSPNITVQNIVLSIDSAGANSIGAISVVSCNSIVSPYFPADSFHCFVCGTIPTFTASDTIVCINDPVFFVNTTAEGLICFEKWNVDGQIYDGSIDTINISFSNPGVYPIKLYANCGMATDTFRLNVHVYPPPQTNFTVPDNCILDSTLFNNTTTILSGSVSSWEWDFGDNNFSMSRNPSHLYNQPGSYLVHLLAISDYGCRDSISDNVNIFPLPAASFTSDDACLRDSLHFYSNSHGQFPINNYAWIFDDGYVSTMENASHLYFSPGNYSVLLQVSDINGCTDDYSASVNVYPMPEAQFEFPDKCNVLPYAHFKNESVNSVQWFWDFGDHENSTIHSPAHGYKNMGLFNVTLRVVSDKGCVDSISGVLEVAAFYNFWIPNAFTPNADGTNDHFMPVTEGVSDFKMDIYDRWGIKIFSTNDLSKGWDGRLDGGEVQSDVYVYKIEIVDFCTEKHTYIGHVSVIR